MIKKNYSELFEFTSAQLARLKKEYEPLKGRTLGMDQINKMNTMLSKYSTDMLVKLANTDIPFLATAAKSIAVMKRGKKWSDFKTKLDMSEADELQQEACWVGYKQVGMKKKGDRMVPNCVPEDKELIDEADLSKSQVKMVHKKADDLPKKDFIKRYGKDGDSVRYATATNMVKKKLGIEEEEFVPEQNQPKGDKQMQEQSYKDKFNATMKDFGIKSLGDLKSDEEKKKFFKAVDAKHDAKDEELEEGLTPAQKKLPPGLQKAIAKKQGDSKDEMMSSEMMKKELKTGDDDMAPMSDMKLNAVVKDPHKSKEDEPKKDMNAMYMKSDVKAPVKDGGGADMAKVKDKPAMQTAMKKINAMYKERYMNIKPGSIEETISKMKGLEEQPVTTKSNLDKMVKDYLKKGGTISKLPPALRPGEKPSDMVKHKIGMKGVVKAMYKMKEVRDFITTYNSHFLTNFKAEEFIVRDRLEG